MAESALSLDLLAQQQRQLAIAYPAPEVQAQERGYLAQVPVGVVRGLGLAAAGVPRMLSAMPGVREFTEPVAEAIEGALPLPSGGYLESGLASGISSLATAGLAAATIAATGGTATPLAIGALVGTQRGFAGLAESRQRLEGLNQALLANGQQPLSTGEIYKIATTQGLIEGGGEALSNFILTSRFLGGAAAEAVRTGILSRVPGAAGRFVRETGIIAGQEIPTEMAQAAGQAAVERATVGEARVQALQQGGQPIAPAPGAAATAVIGPTAVASALFGGVVALGGRARPQVASGEATSTVATAPPSAPTAEAPTRRPLPFVSTPRATDAINPLTGEGAVSTPQAPPPPGQGLMVNPLTGETVPTPAPPTPAPPPPAPVPSALARAPLPSRVNPLTGEGAPSTAGILARQQPLPEMNPLTGELLHLPPATASGMVATGEAQAVPGPGAGAPGPPPAAPVPAPGPPAPAAPAQPAPAPVAPVPAADQAPPSLPEAPPPVPPPPQGIQQAAPQALRLDPERFQYKLRPGAGATTGTLADVRTFDPLKAGVVQVWQDPEDGHTYVVNGHNRVALAQRTGTEAINIQYIPAHNATEARAVGALTNIAEGRGTALDAAKYFRDSEQTAETLAEHGVPLHDKVAREGLALARLNPALFGAVVRADFPLERAVIIGQQLPDQAQQFALVHLLEAQERRGRRLTNDAVRELAAMAQAAPQRTDTEMTLFGAEERTQNLAVEKAQLLAQIRRRLARDRRLFGLVGQTSAAQDLTRVGNIIDIQRQQQVSQEAAQLLDLFDRLKHLSGPITEAIDDAVVRIAGGENATRVHNELYARLARDLPAALQGPAAQSGGSGTPDVGPGRGMAAPAAGESPQGSLLLSPRAAATPAERAPEAPAASAAPAQEPAGVSQENQGFGRELALRSDYQRALTLRASSRLAPSIELLQRSLRINSQRAAAVMSRLEADGQITPPDPANNNRRQWVNPPPPGSPRAGQQPGAAAPGSLRLGPAGGPTPPTPLTAETLQRAFPGQRVRDVGDGRFLITTESGASIVLHQPQAITPTRQELELGYGTARLGEGQQVLGRTTPLGQTPLGAVFRLEVTPAGGTATLFHESAHFFEDAGFLTSQDLRTLERAMARQGGVAGFPAGPEARAEFLGQRLNAAFRLGAEAGPLQRVVRKVRQFFDRLARLLGIRTTGQLVRQVRSGAIFTRAADATPGQPGRLQVAPRPEGTPRALFADAQTEAKAYPAYAHVAHMLTPEERAQFAVLEQAGQARFRKEVIPDVAMAAAGERQMQDWQDNPASLERFLAGMRAGKFTATEPQMVALSLLADEERQMAKVLSDQGILSPERFAQVEDAWYSNHGLLHYATMAASTFGRGLRLQRMLGNSPYLGGAIMYQNAREALQEKLNAIPEAERPAFEEKLRRAFEAGDYATLRELAQHIPNSTWRERFFEFYYGSILSGIGTQAANEYSTLAYQTFQHALIRPVAGLIDATVSTITGRDRQIFTSEAMPALAATFKGLPASFKNAWWVWRGDPRAQQLPDIFRGPASARRDLSGAHGAWARATDKDGQPIAWMRRAAPMVTAATRLMEAMDTSNMQLAFDAEVAALARRAALTQQIPAPSRAAFEDNYRRTFLSQQSQATVSGVMETVKANVFRDGMSRLARAFVSLDKQPVLGVFTQLLVPFRSTPDALIRRGLELLPGVKAVPWYVHNTTWKWGGWLPMVSQEAFTEEATYMLAKQAVGTLMTMGVVSLWLAGNLTGAPSSDPAEREAEERQGKVPNALRVGNTWYSWRRFEPLSLPLGIITNAAQAIQRRSRTMERQGEVPVAAVHDMLAIAAVAVQASIAYVMDASYFSGIANFFQGVQGQRSGTGDIPKGVMRQVSSMVTPFVGLQRSLANAIETSGLVPGTSAGQVAMRSPETGPEFLATFGLPLVGTFTRYGAQPRLSLFGEPRGRQSSVLGELLPLVPPVQRGTATGSELEATLARLNYYPAAPARTDAASGIKLSREQYRRLQEIRGDLLETRLEQVIQKRGFERLPVAEQRKALRDAVSDAGRQARRRLAREGAGV